MTRSIAKDVGRAPSSVRDLFKVGIGPSSSHTMGPMLAASRFVQNCRFQQKQISRVRATLFGSLAWTGKGHATDRAIVLGFSGFLPDSVDADRAEALFTEIVTTKELRLGGEHAIRFDRDTDLIFDKAHTFERHSNAMQFEALSRGGVTIASEIWYSVGGGVHRSGR